MQREDVYMCALLRLIAVRGHARCSDFALSARYTSLLRKLVNLRNLKQKYYAKYIYCRI